jgi:hypothetical protein
MPARKIAARGGAVRVRTITLPDGRRATVYVVRRKGPRGGKTVLGEIKSSKSSKQKGK